MKKLLSDLGCLKPSRRTNIFQLFCIALFDEACGDAVLKNASAYRPFRVLFGRHELQEEESVGIILVFADEAH